MALTLVIIRGAPGGGPVVGQCMNYVVGVTNTSALSVTLTALAISPGPGNDIVISQPAWLTPTTAIGSPGYPTITAGGTSYFPFSLLFTSPNMPGVSPNNPGGSLPGQDAMEADAVYEIRATAQASDSSTGLAILTVPVLSTVAPFPVPTGGAAQFGPGNGSDVALLAAIL